MDPKTRLRKACDACSIRKVKVCLVLPGNFVYTCTNDISVMPAALLVGAALAWTYRVHMSGRVDAVGLQIGTRRR
jgi:hypothetical protein